jgi:hypothetical protein
MAQQQQQQQRPQQQQQQQKQQQAVTSKTSRRYPDVPAHQPCHVDGSACNLLPRLLMYCQVDLAIHQ